MKSIHVVSLLSLIFICSFSNKEESETTKPLTEKKTKTAEKVVAKKAVFKIDVALYSKYLSTLDINKASSVTAALTFFDKKNLAGIDEKVIDECYVKLVEFHKKTLEPVNQDYMELPHPEKTVIAALFGRGYDRKAAKKATKEQIKYYNLLKNNGFTVREGEGDTWLVRNELYIAKKVMPVLSPAMNAFLTQTQKEFKEGFASDAGLDISPLMLAKRIVFWEAFNEKYPKCVMVTDEFVFGLQDLPGILFYGMDNTPAFDRSTTVLGPDFKKAYEYLIKNHPDTEIGKMTKQYYQMLEKSGFKETEAALKFVQGLPKG